ncbi:MAG: DUF6174 domain-containing protein [Candidatus Hydrogenedentes bacterium]|nr:DUF6174 domain-containing protein [Candidatus Hydrogenedentota bacterium]
MRHIVMALVCFLLVTVSCQHVGDHKPPKSYAPQRRAELDTLKKNREKWRINVPRKYTIEITEWSTFRETKKKLVFRHDQIVVAGGSPMTITEFNLLFKERMETYFDLAERSLVEADAVKILYDEKLGYPRRLTIDWDFVVIDEEEYIALRVIDHATVGLDFTPPFLGLTEP